MATIVGRKLPEVHRLTVTRLFSVPPEELWQLLENTDRPEWKGIRISREAEDEPRSMALRLIDEKGPFRGTWLLELEALAGGTQLTVAETGTISNPIARVMAHYLLGEDAMVKAFMDGLAHDLRPAE